MPTIPKSNTDILRLLLHKYHDTEMPADISEALKLIENIIEVQKLREQVLENVKSALTDAEIEIENFTLPEENTGLTEVFLGLDTLYYRLESGNLIIQQKLENWINNIKEQNCAGVLL